MQLKPKTTVQIQTLLKQRVHLLRNVSKALNGGPPINWNVGDTIAYTAQLKRLGFNVLTRGQATAQGFVIPDDATPLGLGRYAPPIGQALEIYILELAGLPADLDNPPEVDEQAEPVQIRILPDGRLDAQSAAAYCKLSTSTMAMMRSNGTGPKFTKRGRINLFYFRTDLDEWLMTRANQINQGAQAVSETKTPRKKRAAPAKPKTATAKPKRKAPAKKAPKVEVRMLDTPAAADYCNKTVKAMQMMRYQHTGPSYERNGNRVMYKSTDLDAWLATRN